MTDGSVDKGLRTIVEPRLGPAVAAILGHANAKRGLLSRALSQVKDWPDVGSILETHDPRWIAMLVDQIRRSTEEVLLKWAPLNHAETAVRSVRAALKIDKDAAFPLMTVWSGYAREEAVRGIVDIPGPFCLAMIVHRTNDWVGTVRTAAEAKLASLKVSLKPQTVIGCIEFLWDFDRVGRADSTARLLVSELSNSPAVLAGLEREALSGATDRSFRIFRKLLRGAALDDQLASIAATSPHPRIRATATRALLSGTFQWLDEGAPQNRRVNVPIDRASFARAQVNDRSPAVQLASLEYTVAHGSDWDDYQELLIRFADDRRGALADIARWGLKQAGVDWVERLRARFNSEPSPRIASLLGKFGTPEDGAAFYALASAMTDQMALPYLAAAAEQKVGAGARRLGEIAIHGEDIIVARRASRALARLGIVFDRHDLQNIADRGDEFFARGLSRHFGKLNVVSQLNILARLEAANADFNLEEWFAKPRIKVNRGAFLIGDAELNELRQLFERAPRVRTLAHAFLALG